MNKAFSAIVLTIILAACQTEELPQPYNILFIAIDDLRPELANYGKTYVHAPVMDSLAQNGTRFEKAYCSVAWCAPSRTSLMTGLRPQQTGVMDLTTHFRSNIPDVVTLPQFFKQQGYTSLGFGKLYHNSPDMQDSLSWSEQCWLPPMEQPILAYATEANQQIADSNRWRKASATEAAEVPDKAYPDGMVASQAIAALAKLKEENKPFFLGVGFYKPHLPFTAPRKYWDLYDPAKIPLADTESLPENASPFMFRDWSEPGSYLDVTEGTPYSDSLSRHLKHGYLACISYIDAQIGKLMNALEQHGLQEKTIVVIWGDHGWKLGDYGRWSKHSNMEIDTRVPLIVSIPGQESRVVEQIVETIDIYPSLVKYTGFDVPEYLAGEDLMDKRREYALSQIPRDTITGYTVRTPKFRYIEWRSEDSQVKARELYDHRQDDLELVNIASDSSYASTIQNLAIFLPQ